MLSVAFYALLAASPIFSRPVQPSNGRGAIAGAPVTARTDFPFVIYPSPRTTPPPGTTFVQIGFGYSLRWEFVADPSPGTDGRRDQIFTYAPRGVAYGLNIADSQVVMKELRAYDTSATLGYITTLAEMWIPSDLVLPLRFLVENPNSRLYNNPDASEDTLMGQINPAIPIA